MNSFFTLIIRKTFSNRNRMIMSIINFTLVLFLVTFLLTIGFNVKKNNNLTLENNNLYKQILVQRQDIQISDIDQIANFNGVDKVVVETAPQFIVTNVNNIALLNAKIVYQYKLDRDHPSDLGIIIYGESLSTQLDIIISKQYLEQLNVSVEEAIGQPVNISDGNIQNTKTIVGVFDSDLLIDHKQDFIIQDINSDSDINSLIITVDSLDDINKTTEFLQENDFDLVDYFEEISIFKSLSIIINISSLVIGIMIISMSAILLTNSTRISIINIYRFISLLKSMGFTRRKLRVFVYVELAFITFVSCSIAFTLNYAVLSIMMRFISVDNIFPMQQINLIDINIYAYAVTFGLAMLLMLYSIVKSAILIDNLDVMSLFKEGTL